MKFWTRHCDAISYPLPPTFFCLDHRSSLRIIMIVKPVKYSRIFANIKTDFECYNLLWLCYRVYFLEQQSPSNCRKPIIVDYCLVTENVELWE